jgi:hypothetical protein
VKRFILFLALALVILVLCGCQGASVQTGDFKGQGLSSSFQSSASPGYIIITREDGSVQVLALPTTEVSRAK